jgi:hypothetical protein
MLLTKLARSSGFIVGVAAYTLALLSCAARDAELEPVDNKTGDLVMLDGAEQLHYEGGADAQQEAWQQTLLPMYAGSAATMFKIQLDGRSPSKWIVSIQTNDSATLWTVDSTTAGGEQVFWTEAIPATGDPFISIQGDTRGLKVRVEEIVRISGRAAVHTTIGEDKREDVGPSSPALVRQLSSAIVFLEIIRKSPNRERRGRFGCTAFGVDATHLVTARHCVAHTDEGETLSLATALVTKDGAQDPRQKPTRVAFEVVDTNPLMDVALIKLRSGSLPGFLARHISRNACSGSAMLLQGLYTAELGWRRQISLAGCVCKMEPDKPFIRHSCDVSNTGSGAPLTDGNGEVVGVHLGGITSSEFGNVAAPISAIYKDQ